MTEVVLSPQDLESYIPHRGVNLIPDSVTMAEDRQSATSRTQICVGDARGREIFGRRDAAGKLVWNEVFLAELLALTGVPLLRERLGGDDRVAVFSTIGRLSVARAVGMDEELTGYAEITRERSGFSQFTSLLMASGEEVYRGDIMSGSSTLAEISAGATTVDGDFPAGNEPISEWPWKQPGTRFIDGFLEENTEAGSIRCAYTYPTDHAFVAGHFPGAPLMMGVTQWCAIFDAAFLASQRAGHGDGQFRCNGKITRLDGSEIVNVRDLAFTVESGHPRILTLNRLAFREVIRPGDKVIVEATMTVDS